MFQLIILTLLLNLPITPMPSERVTVDGIPGRRPIVSPYLVNWWQDSALPGAGSNVVLYGHSRILSPVEGPGVFAHLHKLTPGAVITVTSLGRDYGYIVSRVFVIDENKDQREAGLWIDPTPAERLTLVTCAGEDRLIVVAEALR